MTVYLIPTYVDHTRPRPFEFGNVPKSKWGTWMAWAAAPQAIQIRERSQI